MKPSILKKLLMISTCVLFGFQAHASNSVVEPLIEDTRSEYQKRFLPSEQATDFWIYNQDATVDNADSTLSLTSKISIPYLVEDGPRTWEMINMDKLQIKVANSLNSKSDIDSSKLEPGTRDFFVSHVFATAQQTFLMNRRSLEIAQTVFKNDILLKQAIARWDSLPFGILRIHPLGLPGERNAYYNRQETGGSIDGQRQYERELSFGYFNDRGKTIFTGSSPDVVAHESGHAATDLNNPTLFDSSSNQTIAIHEAAGDLNALFYVLYHAPMAYAVTIATKCNLRSPQNFASNIAEQFGKSVSNNNFLRNLNALVKISDVKDQEPHALSLVLSGAYFEVMANVYQEAYSKYIHMNSSAWLLQTVSFHALTLFNHAMIHVSGQNPTISDFARAILASEQTFRLTKLNTVAYIDINSMGWKKYLIDSFAKREVKVDNIIIDADILTKTTKESNKASEEPKRNKKGPCKLFEATTTNSLDKLVGLTNLEPGLAINTDCAVNSTLPNYTPMPSI